MPPLLRTLRHALVLETLFATLIHSKSFVVPRIIIITLTKSKVFTKGNRRKNTTDSKRLPLLQEKNIIIIFII